MKKYHFDFRNISSMDMFYDVFLQQTAFDATLFGRNLDALYDVLTSEMQYPCQLIFNHIQRNQVLEFVQLIDVIFDAEEALETENGDLPLNLVLEFAEEENL